MVQLIAINSINRSLLETMENNSLAGAYNNQKGEVGMAAGCGMLIRGQPNGMVPWHLIIAIMAVKLDEMRKEIQIFAIIQLIQFALIALNGNISYYRAYSAQLDSLKLLLL